MKPIINFLGNVLYAITIIVEILEVSAVPLLLIVIGIANDFAWQYYVISIGIYIALFAIAELIAYLVGKALGRKFEPIIIKAFRQNSGNAKNDVVVSKKE